MIQFYFVLFETSFFSSFTALSPVLVKWSMVLLVARPWSHVLFPISGLLWSPLMSYMTCFRPGPAEPNSCLIFRTCNQNIVVECSFEPFVTTYQGTRKATIHVCSLLCRFCQDAGHWESLSVRYIIAHLPSDSKCRCYNLTHHYISCGFLTVCNRARNS